MIYCSIDTKANGADRNDVEAGELAKSASVKLRECLNERKTEMKQPCENPNEERATLLQAFLSKNEWKEAR